MRISLHFSSDIVIWYCFVRNRVGDQWTITLLFWSERKVVLRMKTCSIVAIAITITMLTNGCSTKNQPTMAGNLNDVAIPQPLKLLSRYFPPHHRYIYLVTCRLQCTWTPYNKMEKEKHWKKLHPLSEKIVLASEYY